MIENPLAEPVEAPRAPGRDLRVVVGSTVLGIFALIALIGPIVLDFDPVEVSTRDRLLPPLADTAEGSIAWLGTDELGRDVMAQIVIGARVSLYVGVVTVVVAGLIGVAVGIISGYFGGWVDSVASRLIELQLAIPPLLLAILIAAVLGPSVRNLIIALALTRWVKFARVSRGVAFKVREQVFVSSGRVLGVSTWRLLTKYILPLTLTPLVVLATVEFGLVILAEAGLSFLGLGTPLSTPSWGGLIARGRQFIDAAWWISVIPGICLVVVGVSAGMVGDGLRDRLGDDAVGGTT